MAATPDPTSVNPGRDLDTLIQQVLAATTWNEVLGIDDNTPADVTKKRYRKLCVRLHPDKAGLDNTRAAAAFAIVHNAYSGVTRRVDGTVPAYVVRRPRPTVDLRGFDYAWKPVDVRPKVRKRAGPRCRRHRKFLPCSRCRALDNPAPSSPPPEPPPPSPETPTEMLELFGF